MARHPKKGRNVDGLDDALEVGPFLLRRGTTEHYEDAVLYDYEYRRRRADVHFYVEACREANGPILELGCGTGRILVPLVAAGHHVIGLDRNRAMLGRAAWRLTHVKKRRARSSAMGSSLLVLADAGQAPLALPSPGTQRARAARIPSGKSGFARILCPFNALQHFYDHASLSTLLCSVHALLAPDGEFIFDVMNPHLGWLARDPYRIWAKTRFRHPATGEPWLYGTNHCYDAPTQLNFIRLYYRNLSTGKMRTVRIAHRMFFPLELELILETHGFSVEARFGDFKKHELSTENEQQVVIARRR